MTYFLLVGILLVVWQLAVIRHQRLVARWDGSGSPSQGIIVFVEPVRWLFIIWGFLSFARGLRQAGCRHQLRLFRWSSRVGALLVLPDLMRQERLLAKAGRLARFITQVAAEHPDRPIYLCGYSSGCYLVVEAVKLAPDLRAVEQIALLAATVSPQYDLRPIIARTGALHSFHSYLDACINGFGPLVFGSNDRQHTLAAGMIGFASPPPGLVQHGWTPRDVRLGYWGGHFTLTRSRFVAERIAPLFLTTTSGAPPAD